MIEKLVPLPADVWVYLSASPLSWLTLTLIAFIVADRISIASGRHPAVNLVALAAGIVILLLKITGVSYETYFAGAQFIHFLLGPATVALAIPLYRNFDRVKAAAWPILGSLLIGSVTAIASAVLIAKALGGSHELAASLAPKSVTAPIAMGLSEKIGGAPFLTTALVIATGIFGAVSLTPLMRLLRITDPAAVGMAAGLSAHGIGTARAFHIDSTAGAFAGIAMGLNGALTSVILPFLRPWLGL
jgi:predicted murein hydrolase (TIGR00659 family)